MRSPIFLMPTFSAASRKVLYMDSNPPVHLHHTTFGTTHSSLSRPTEGSTYSDQSSWCPQKPFDPSCPLSGRDRRHTYDKVRESASLCETVVLLRKSVLSNSSASFDDASLTHLFSVSTTQSTTQTDKLLSASNADESSSLSICHRFVVVVDDDVRSGFIQLQHMQLFMYFRINTISSHARRHPPPLPTNSLLLSFLAVWSRPL